MTNFFRIFLLSLFFLPVRVSAAPSSATSGFAEEAWFYEDSASIGALTFEPISHIPGVVSVISQRSIAGMGARLLTDVLKQVPGFDLSYNNFGEFFLAIRGIDKPSNVLVLIDGNRFNDFYSGDSLYDIPVDNIERIEILRGPGSSLYGTNAMVGVINIITKNEIGLSARIGGGEFDTWKANVQFGNLLGYIEFYGFSEFYKTRGGDALIEEDLAKRQNLPHITPGRLADHKEKIQGYLGVKTGGYKGTLNYYREERGPNVGYRRVMARGTTVKTFYLSAAIEKTYLITKKVEFSPRLFTHHRKRALDIQLYPDGFQALTEKRELFPDGPWQQKKYETMRFGGDLRFKMQSDEKNTLQAGVVWEKSRILNTDYKTNYSDPKTGNVYQGDVAFQPSFANWDNFGFPEKSRSVIALYLQEDWQPVHYFNLVGGVRYDSYSDFGDTLNPRIALIFFPWIDVDIKFQYATSFRAPTFRELYDETDIEFLGNPDLGPEKIRTFEAGIGYSFAPKSFFRVNAYKNTISGSIGLEQGVGTTSAVQQRRYENKSGQGIVGVEAEARFSYNNDSFLYGNASIFNARDFDSASWLTRVPQVRANAGLNHQLPWNTAINISLIYGGKRVTNTLDQDKDFIIGNIQRASWYTLVNMAVSKKGIMNTGLGVKLSIFNIFDSDYREIVQDHRFVLTELPDREARIPTNQRSYFIEVFKDI